MSSERTDAQCPECNGKFKVSMQDAMRGRLARCPRGHLVHLKDEGGQIGKLERELRKIDEDFRF